MVTPDLSVTLSDTQSPMTGVLEAYPCQAGGAIYYGNYIEGKLTPFPGMYYLQNGEIYGDKNREISLPVGTYNMIYWGTPKYEEPIYSNPVVVDPQITIGGDLSQQYFGLRKVSADDGKSMTVALLICVPSADSTSGKDTVLVWLTGAAVYMFKLIIKLKNGNTKVYQQPLNAPLKANNKLTLTLTLGDIFSEETSGGFTIDNWKAEPFICKMR